MGRKNNKQNVEKVEISGEEFMYAGEDVKVKAVTYATKTKGGNVRTWNMKPQKDKDIVDFLPEDRAEAFASLPAPPVAVCKTDGLQFTMGSVERAAIVVEKLREGIVGVTKAGKPKKGFFLPSQTVSVPAKETTETKENTEESTEKPTETVNS